MNGRIYDPSLGRMLQADPIANPGSQGLNRYSYVANNPLTLTDPTGYSWFSSILKAVAGIAIAIWAPELLAPHLGTFGSVIGAGFLAGFVTTGSLQGALTGAFSAGLFYGIGQAFEAGGFANGWAAQGDHVFGTDFNLAGFSAKVLAHGVAGGVMSSLQGGKFGSGFASAGIAESFSGAIDGIDKGNPIGQAVSAQRIVAAAILGGTTAVIAGGKFGNGAITAAFSRAFNQERHTQTKDAYGSPKPPGEGWVIGPKGYWQTETGAIDELVYGEATDLEKLSSGPTLKEASYAIGVIGVGASGGSLGLVALGVDGVWVLALGATGTTASVISAGLNPSDSNVEGAAIDVVLQAAATIPVVEFAVLFAQANKILYDLGELSKHNETSDGKK